MHFNHDNVCIVIINLASSVSHISLTHFYLYIQNKLILFEVISYFLPTVIHLKINLTGTWFRALYVCTYSIHTYVPCFSLLTKQFQNLNWFHIITLFSWLYETYELLRLLYIYFSITINQRYKNKIRLQILCRK